MGMRSARVEGATYKPLASRAAAHAAHTPSMSMAPGTCFSARGSSKSGSSACRRRPGTPAVLGGETTAGPRDMLEVLRQQHQRPATPTAVAPGTVDGIPPKFDTDAIAARLRALPRGARAYELNLLPQTWRPEIQAILQDKGARRRAAYGEGDGGSSTLTRSSAWPGERSRRPSSAPAGSATNSSSSYYGRGMEDFSSAEGGVEGMRAAAEAALDEETEAYYRRIDEALFWQARNMESRIAPNLPMWPMGFMKNTTYRDSYRNHKMSLKEWKTARSADPRLRADSRFVPTSLI